MYNVHNIKYRNSETTGYQTRCLMQLVQSSGLTPDDCTSCMKHRVG